MHPALARTDHRPWPIPSTHWWWRQTWHDLLFAHWPVSVEAVRSLVPDWLTVQECDGSTWVGLVPFRMTGVTLRHVPSLPVISHFPEMNLRLYVERGGKPGVWFMYSSIRSGGRVVFEGTYSPVGPVRESEPGSLEHFLTARYCLYTQDSRGRPLRLNIHHLPWPLQPADAEFVTNRVAEPQGIQLPDTAPLLHFSRRIDVIGWGFERI